MQSLYCYIISHDTTNLIGATGLLCRHRLAMQVLLCCTLGAKNYHREIHECTHVARSELQGL